MPDEARAVTRSHRKSLRLNKGPLAGGLDGHRAILGTPDGGQIHCLIEQFNDSGAYLLRARSIRPARPLRTGDQVAIHVGPRGIHGPKSVTLDGTVTRIEAGGPGLAIRFAGVEQEESNPYNDLSSDDWMTEVPETQMPLDNLSNGHGINFQDFGVPQQAANSKPSPPVSVKRVLRYAFVVAFALSSLAVFVLFGDWLGAVVL